MSRNRFFLLTIAMGFCLFPTATTEARLAQNDPYDKVIDSLIDREDQIVAAIATFSPVVETYMQHIRPDKELGEAPSGDRYFLTKLVAGKDRQGQSMTVEGGLLSRIKSTITNIYGVRYDRMGLVDMILIDEAGFTKAKYDFRFVRKEFLGDVRCLVFDVQPKSKKDKKGFSGRIWVEDEANHIVRFNGIKGRSESNTLYFHTDSWRQYIGGKWLPVYVYSEESDLEYGPVGRLNFKAQTRLWGYNLDDPKREDERTSLVVASDAVRDRGNDSDASDSPVLGARAWVRQAEDNVIERMQRAGLLAPEGEVDAVLKTVAANLEITNNLAFDPPIRARVLLTSPMESFTLGHTLVISRGLIDVLPDEASLAMVVAHELAHVALGHRLDTRYAFFDRMLFEDHDSFSKLIVKRTDAEEQAADKKALELLNNSPYKDKLGNAGLFLKAVEKRAKQLPHLLRPHMGNRIIDGKEVVRMRSLTQGAPELRVTSIDQIAALPLGGRVRVDPWNATISLVKSKPVALNSAQEKMAFEIAPLFPYLSRQTSATPAALAIAEPEARETKPATP
jgi:hypothetical protein